MRTRVVTYPGPYCVLIRFDPNEKPECGVQKLMTLKESEELVQQLISAIQKIKDGN